MIVIIDYGLGNLGSVKNTLDKLGVDSMISKSVKKIKEGSALILPGVGSANQGMKNLNSRKLSQVLIDEIKKGKPFLGICLGLQLLFSKGYEDGEHEGLDIIPGKVVRFKFSENGSKERLKIPHMGWNQISFRKKDNPLLQNVPCNAYMYFVHSYYVCPEDNSVIATETDYGVRFTSMVWHKNVFATQFHPEKSQQYGLTILRNFGNL